MDRKNIKKYELTVAGFGIAISVLLLTVTFKFDLFERVMELLVAVEHYEVDELIIPTMIFLLFALIDQARMRKSQEIELERVKIYKAMLASTQHILNNFLNQMLLVQMAAKDTPDFDPEVLALYETIVNDASTQIEALSSITQIDEASIHKSVEP